MKHAKSFILLGITVALVPFLGLPIAWDTVLLIVLGISIALLGVRNYVAVSQGTHEAQSDAEEEVDAHDSAPSEVYDDAGIEDDAEVAVADEGWGSQPETTRSAGEGGEDMFEDDGEDLNASYEEPYTNSAH